ncbi:hypothetical protein OH492_27380 [Vibrio chagasii]|nr:hypothetical protein [Vibrio chagasii]
MTTPKEKPKAVALKKAGKSTENQKYLKTRQRIEELLEERELAKLLEL